MSIKEILKDIVENTLNIGGDSFRFYHGDENDINLETDEQTFPFVALLSPVKNKNITVASGAIYEKYILHLFFLYKSELDWNPEEHEVVIQKARLAKNQFLSILNKDSRIRSFEESDSIEVFNKTDVNLSGIYLMLSATPQINNSVCV